MSLVKLQLILDSKDSVKQLEKIKFELEHRIEQISNELEQSRQLSSHHQQLNDSIVSKDDFLEREKVHADRVLDQLHDEIGHLEGYFM